MTSVRFSVRFQFYEINCGFGFSGSVYTYVCQHHTMLIWFDTRNDVLLCWIGPTNSHLNWLRTRSIETRHEENYFESLTVDPIMLEDELWMRQCKNTVPKPPKSVYENWSVETEFSFYLILRSVRFCSVFRKHVSDNFVGFSTPQKKRSDDM